jgi:hypothetical protein
MSSITYLRRGFILANRRPRIASHEIQSIHIKMSRNQREQEVQVVRFLKETCSLINYPVKFCERAIHF